MSLRDLRKTGHLPTLLSAFLYFDVSFMVWVIYGPLGPFIGEAYRLSPSQKGLLTAVPLLGGSLFRPVLGWMTERVGGRKTALGGLALTLVPLFMAWKVADSFSAFIALGLLLGVSGASFAAALPLASAWYPLQYQGLVMGIAGAGNSGTLLATLFAPRLAQVYGWRSVFGITIVPVALIGLTFFLFAKDAPVLRKAKRLSDYASLLKIPDTGWFCFIYCLTFGGFVGFSSYLPIFFHDQYGLSKVRAGDFTTLVVLFGSFLRPVGGLLADRFGGYRMLLGVFMGICLCLAIVAMLPPAGVALLILATGIGMLGIGNGSVFQLVPQRFPDHVGIMTGIIGSAGGLGGFLFPFVLGLVKQYSGSFGIGFAIASVVMLAGAGSLAYLRSVWRKTWPLAAARRAGLIVETEQPQMYAERA